MKRLATKSSLQRPFEDQIQSAIELYEWAKGAIPSIHFQYVTTAEYEAEEILLRKRLESAITIVGTHSFHVYYPMHDKINKLEVKVYSCCPASEIVRVSSNRDLSCYGGHTWLYYLCIRLQMVAGFGDGKIQCPGLLHHFLFHVG